MILLQLPLSSSGYVLVLPLDGGKSIIKTQNIRITESYIFIHSLLSSDDISFILISGALPNQQYCR